MRAIASLAPAVSGYDQLASELEDFKRASARGYFTPDEDERVRARFAQYLTARAGLLQTIDELKPIALSRGELIDDETRMRAFVISYTGTALLVRAARFIVFELATNSLVQRKLNEPEPRFGIPNKQYTAIYRSLTSPINAWQIHEAIEFADANRSDLNALNSDSEFKLVLDYLHEAEESLRVTVGNFMKARLRYRWHSLRRRRASAVEQAMFSLFELSGRVIADVRNPFHSKRVTTEIQSQLESILKPGDVLITRHDDAMSNLFLPGYWIHASLYIGSIADRTRLGITVDPDRSSKWIDPIRVLEARKDGVLFRRLSDTLSVDCVAVIRPTLNQSAIVEAISRAVTHEGKLYDFEFNFLRSDRLVCTEVVYRGFHGVGGLEIELKPRASRITLSAEDLISMALDRRGFEPVAVFGVPNRPGELLFGEESAESLRQRRQ